jgi:DNA-binding transcriptional LysR family regulator
MAALLEIAEHGSLSAAGRQLGVTPSAVSKLISRLEGRLKVRLINRTTRQAHLTDLGLSYCHRARNILDSIKSLECDVQNQDPVPRGTLRISAPCLLGHDRILPVVISFALQCPDVQIHLELSDRVADLDEDGIDVAVRITSSAPPSVAARKLADDRRVLCASPGYVAERGLPVTPDELLGHDCICAVNEFRPRTWNLRPTPASEPRPVAVSGRLQINNTAAIKQAALAGFGIADLPAYLIEDDLASGRLLTVLAEFVPVERAIYAIYLPAASDAPKVRVFVGALEAAFAASAGPTGQRLS